MGKENCGRKKGGQKYGGRQKGTPNLISSDIKERFKLIVENNLDNITMWLEQVAAENPAQALMFIKDLAEYNVAKLARTELTGKDGDSIKVATNIIVDDKNNADILTNI